MKIFSAEDQLDAVKATLQKYLPGVITKINTDRSDLTLLQVNNNDYFYNPREATNSNTFIVLEHEIDTPVGGNTKVGLTLQVNIFLGFLIPNLTDTQAFRLACRYQGALYEAVRKGSDEISYDVKYVSTNQGKVSMGNRDLYGVMWTITMPLTL